jgi:hypothetical protein
MPRITLEQTRFFHFAFHEIGVSLIVVFLLSIFAYLWQKMNKHEQAWA